MPRRKYIRGTVQERLTAYIRALPNGCWEWTGLISKAGYGVMGVDQEMLYAHRLVHELARGPIPDGLDLDHTCHDPALCTGGSTCQHRRCVNPYHTEPTTRGINVGRTRSSRFFVIHTVCAVGHPLTPDNVYRRGVSVMCKICTKARSIATHYRNYVPAPPRTHCKRGHPVTEDNIYLRKNGVRLCLTCLRQNTAEWRRNNNR